MKIELNQGQKRIFDVWMSLVEFSPSDYFLDLKLKMERCTCGEELMLLIPPQLALESDQKLIENSDLSDEYGQLFRIFRDQGIVPTINDRSNFYQLLVGLFISTYQPFIKKEAYPESVDLLLNSEVLEDKEVEHFFMAARLFASTIN